MRFRDRGYRGADKAEEEGWELVEMDRIRVRFAVVVGFGVSKVMCFSNSTRRRDWKNEICLGCL